MHTLALGLIHHLVLVQYILNFNLTEVKISHLWKHGFKNNLLLQIHIIYILTSINHTYKSEQFLIILTISQLLNFWSIVNQSQHELARKNSSFFIHHLHAKLFHSKPFETNMKKSFEVNFQSISINLLKTFFKSFSNY